MRKVECDTCHQQYVTSASAEQAAYIVCYRQSEWHACSVKCLIALAIAQAPKCRICGVPMETPTPQEWIEMRCRVCAVDAADEPTVRLGGDAFAIKALREDRRG